MDLNGLIIISEAVSVYSLGERRHRCAQVITITLMMVS
jgi:hypothetical protein